MLAIWSVVPLLFLNPACTSDHRTGKVKFSFQSQRRAMTKNVETTIPLYSFHMLERLFSKSFKLGFGSTWTEHFQMYKRGLEEAEKPEIKLPTFVGLWKKQGRSGKTSTSASLMMSKPLTVWITAIYKASSDSHFAFLHFFFLGMVLIPVSCTMSRTSDHSSSGTQI